MIPQLVQLRAAELGGGDKGTQDAMTQVLGSDPLDLVLRMEQVWDAAQPYGNNPAPAGPARRSLFETGAFKNLALPPAGSPGWEHLAYAFCIENTRAAQIISRVVKAFRSGEGLGVPSIATQRWLDATEAICCGALNPLGFWLSTSSARPHADAVRRNAYWRLMGMDLSFGTETNTPFVYDKADAANRGFVPLFEELLFELWKAIENRRNLVGANAADNDRIYRLSEQLGYMLRSRRQNANLQREELAAVTAMGWLELTVSANTPVVVDLRADATSPGDRLRLIGERVGLAPHSKASAFFSMASELSLLLRTLEGNYVNGPDLAPLLYQEGPPGANPKPLGLESRRVITEWSSATGRDMKSLKAPVPVRALAGR